MGLAVFAQQTVTGKITSKADLQPIPGATVQVKGTKTGTQTASDGSFSIKIPQNNSVLVISVVGFEKLEVPVEGRTELGNVSLTSANLALNEIVVTGYSSQRKKDITGSVSIVKVSDLTSTPAANATSMLQGRAAGVNVVNDNVPGSEAKVRIRGFASFTGNDPLYIVDGIPTGGITFLNPGDIETMQVLKDAASCSIYGARASNGVIIVTTKKGKQGPAKVTYDFYYGTQKPGKGYEDKLLDPQGNADLVWLALKNSNLATQNGQYGSGATPVLPDYLLGGTQSGLHEGDAAANPALYDFSSAKLADPNYTPYLIVRANKQGTNWFKEITRNAPITNHNLTVGGGNDRNRYFFAFNYFSQDAILINSFYKRYTLRANNEFNIKNTIRIGENLMAFALNADAPPNGNNYESSLMTLAYQEQPIIPVHNINGEWAGGKGANLGSFRNPVALSDRQKNNRAQALILFGNVYAEVDILKHFTAKTSLGGAYNYYNSFQYPYIEYENAENTRLITYTENNGKNTSWIWTNQLTYKNTFGRHAITALAGVESIKNEGRASLASRADFFTYDNLNFITLGSGAGTQTVGGGPTVSSSLYSLFGKVDYIYNDKYLFSALLRRDGSSRFGAEKRFGYFPAFSAGWRVSEEEFMKNMPWISDLKLRGSWGRMGNERIPADNQFTQFAASGGSAFYDITGSNNSAAQAFYLSFIGNSVGKWEVNTTWNAGFDASLFKGNTEVVFDFYQKKTSDLLFPVEQPGTGGGTGSGNPPYFNVAKMKNWGIDLLISQRGYIGGPRGVKIEATATFTTYKNQITSISDGVDYFDYNSPLNEANRVGASFTRNAVGHPINSYYGYKIAGLFQSDDEATKSNQADAKIGRFKYLDANGDGQITPDDRVYFGDPNPKYSYGLNLKGEYKGFDLTMYFYGLGGRENVNYVRWWTDFYSAFQGGKSKTALYDSWTPQHTNAKVAIQENTGNFSTNNTFNSYLVEKSAYFRMKNLEVGYTISPSLTNKIKIDKLRVYLQATNLFTVTKYSGLDPEVPSYDDRAAGIDVGSYPTVRQYLVGVNVNF
jgi:TonB-linked SusC/RagA family outer membrane protein